MMNTLKIQPTKDTPSINLDADNNEFVIEGNSLPENTPDFYRPVYDWITNYVQSGKKGFKLLVNLNYLNSSSVKFIFALFKKMSDGHKETQGGSDYKIIWKYKSSDELMKQKGDEFKSFLDIPFEVEAY